MKRLTVLLLSLVWLAGCSENSVKHNIELEKSISTIVENQKKSEIDIKHLADFEWDKAFLVTPYTTQESLNEQLGVDFKDPSNINRRDDIYLLVFLNENKVVQYTEINRQQSDFSISEKEHLTPFNASINIERY